MNNEPEPNSAEAYYNQGNSYYSQKKYEEAIADCSKAIELKPDHAEAYYCRGNSYNFLGEYKKAIADFNKAVELKPNYTEAYYCRGNSYNFLGEYKEATTDYSKAIELKPKYANIYYNRGNSYASSKKYEEAITDYNKAIELNPEFAEAYNNRGNCYKELGKHENEIDDYNKAIDLKPNNAYAYNNRGNFYCRKENYNKAIAEYNKAIEFRHEYLEAYYNRGSTFSKVKKYYESNNDFNEYLRLLKDRPSPVPKRDIYLTMGENCTHSNNIDQAIKYFSSSEADPINILGCCKNTDQVEAITSTLIQKDTKYRFNRIIASCNNSELTELYKKIYIYILKIIFTLLIRKKNNFSVAHYTTREAALQLIFEGSPFRLSSVLTTNDPTEGNVLLEYLDVNTLDINSSDIENTSKEKNDFQAFINCFSFNQESLNQFRLYGKEESKEATGVSLVLKGNYFSPNMCLNILPDISKANIEEQKNDEKENNEKENIKFPIFRCLYIDPNEKEVVSIGSRDKDKTKKDIKAIKDFLNEIKKEIEKVGKENLDKNIIDNLFLTLRYLVKHSAFKEERECRIICIKDIVKDAEKEKEKQEVHFNSDYSRMYINYQKIDNTCLDKVIFGPKAEGFEIFREALRHEHIDCECKKSELPFA